MGNMEHSYEERLARREIITLEEFAKLNVDDKINLFDSTDNAYYDYIIEDKYYDDDGNGCINFICFDENGHEKWWGDMEVAPFERGSVNTQVDLLDVVKFLNEYHESCTWEELMDALFTNFIGR